MNEYMLKAGAVLGQKNIHTKQCSGYQKITEVDINYRQRGSEGFGTISGLPLSQ
jgi:hypothetical protein